MILMENRVHFEYHTITQVVVGALVGSIVGLFWRKVLHPKLLQPILVPWLVHSRLGRYLYLKDIARVDDVLETEYNALHGKQQ